MYKISVITPTIRPEGLDIVNTALRRQTFGDFEWLVGSSFEPEFGTWVRDDFTGGFWTLNRIYNKLIQEAKGQLIVSLQDFTLCTPQALEKFWYYFEDDPKTVVSGIGDKYESVYPILGAKVWVDPRRKTPGAFRRIPYNEVEFNFCAIPRHALYSVGGFDEQLDFAGYGMDGYSVVDRLNMRGEYSFCLDEANESYSLVHGRVPGWEEHNLIHGAYDERRKSYISNPTLFYL